MPHQPRPSRLRQRRSERSADIARAAPGRLRQRVLGTVRGEGHVQASGRARVSTRVRWVLLAALAALFAAGLVELDSSSPGTIPTRSSTIALSARTTRASLRRAGTRTQLIVSGMPEPPIGEVYEVWLDRPSAAPQPTDALFTVTSEGNGAVEVPGSLRGVRDVTVTSEPLGGSSSPTTAPVLRLPVAQRH